VAGCSADTTGRHQGGRPPRQVWGGCRGGRRLRVAYPEASAGGAGPNGRANCEPRPGRRAAQFVVDRSRDRSDCGGVHWASGVPV